MLSAYRDAELPLPRFKANHVLVLCFVAMLFRHKYSDGVWIDLEQPSQDEVRAFALEFGISERIESELLSPTLSPLFTCDGEAALLVMHFPSHGHEDGTAKDQEIDFVVGKHFVATIRYEVVAPLYHLQKLLETQQLLNADMALSTDELIEILFAHLYASIREHTNHVAGRLVRVEEQMFSGQERYTVRAISVVSREFLHLEAALANQEGPLARFLHQLAEPAFLGSSFTERGTRIVSERQQVEHVIRTHRAVATELRETNTSLLEARQNAIMKTLTVITFLVLPLELITFIFSMHLPGTPLAQNPDAFWIVIGIMGIMLGFLALYFARNRWIF